MAKADSTQMRRDWQQAMQAIARELETKYSKETPLYKLMGGLAWGRYDYEPRTYGDNADHINRGVGYLMGVRDAALHVGRAMQLPGWELFADIYTRLDVIRMRNKKAE